MEKNKRGKSNSDKDLFIYSLAVVYARGIHNMIKQILFCLLPCFEGSLLSLDSHLLGIKDKYLYILDKM